MMKLRSWETLPILMIILICLLPQPAMAYIGPGAGLSAIGALLAIVAVVIVAIFGFVWYPIRRIMRKMKRTDNDKGGDTE
jgi:nitrate reductase gamma subunit